MELVKSNQSPHFSRMGGIGLPATCWLAYYSAPTTFASPIEMRRRSHRTMLTWLLADYRSISAVVAPPRFHFPSNGMACP